MNYPSTFSSWIVLRGSWWPVAIFAEVQRHASLRDAIGGRTNWQGFEDHIWTGKSENTFRLRERSSSSRHRLWSTKLASSNLQHSLNCEQNKKEKASPWGTFVVIGNILVRQSAKDSAEGRERKGAHTSILWPRLENSEKRLHEWHCFRKHRS